jgi:hypothetical protein
MTVVLGFLIRLLVLYFIIKFLLSLFSNRGKIGNRNQNKSKENVKRYETEEGDIEEADFEEIK